MEWATFGVTRMLLWEEAHFNHEPTPPPYPPKEAFKPFISLVSQERKEASQKGRSRPSSPATHTHTHKSATFACQASTEGGTSPRRSACPQNRGDLGAGSSGKQKYLLPFGELKMRETKKVESPHSFGPIETSDLLNHPIGGFLCELKMRVHVGTSELPCFRIEEVRREGPSSWAGY